MKMETDNMPPEQQNNVESISDCPGIILQENVVSNEQTVPREKRIKRITYFHDGDIVEYFSEDETDAPKTAAQTAAVDPTYIERYSYPDRQAAWKLGSPHILVASDWDPSFCAAPLETKGLCFYKSLNWMPWAWYQTVWVGSKLLNGCDVVGEALADFLGITSPKYQLEIDEYKRLQAQHREEASKEDLEMGGWNERYQNNLITSNKVITTE